MSNSKIIDEAYQEALRVLQNCLHPLGIKASAKVRGYPQIWGRDSMITLLGAVLLQDEKINRALRASFETLQKNQTSLGSIPNNVDTITKKANYQAYADGGLSFIVGCAAFFEATKDASFLKKRYPAIKRILNWYQYQDVDQSGLISIQEAADWEDLFATRGKGVYVNVLYCLALRKASRIAKELGDVKQQHFYQKRWHEVAARINERLWFTPGRDPLEIVKDSFGTELGRDIGILKRKIHPPPKKILQKDKYYLPYVSFRSFGEWFDSFGNLLAILAGVANQEQSKEILKVIQKYQIAEPYPIKGIHPPILPEESDWRPYYRFADLNLPHRYHNGGIWPFLGGFYVAVLVKMKKYKKAKESLIALALLNKKGIENEWEFNEWFHGESGKPMGMAEQAWSAGMYIYAYEAVRSKKLPFF